MAALTVYYKAFYNKALPAGASATGNPDSICGTTHDVGDRYVLQLDFDVS